MDALESITQPGRAAALLDPLRLRLLALAREPASASEMARRLGLPRQRVNYHVRALARARYLKQAGHRRRRNMIETRYVATARSYVLSPELLGGLAADRGSVEDTLSASYLMALGSQMQSDVGKVARGAAAAGKRLATLSFSADLRFLSAQQRAAFSAALQQAVIDVIGKHSASMSAGQGHPFRIVLGCYPIPREETHEATL